MWINTKFEADARRTVVALLAESPLVTLVAEAPLRAAHVPLLVDEQSGPDLVLVGHIPRADPVSAAIEAGERLLCVVHGPRAYVSAAWYGSVGLPTYNFSVAHLMGTASAMADPGELRAHLRELAQEHERAKPPVDEGPWRPGPDAEARIDMLLPQILGFRLAVDQAQAKAKLGQNRPVADRVATAEFLDRSAAAEHQAVAALMREEGTH
jgi:transcriptional regulator